MVDKVAGDLRIRIEYLERQINKHNQKHKDLQIVLAAEVGLLDGISDQFSRLNTSLAGDHGHNKESFSQFSNFDPMNSINQNQFWADGEASKSGIP